MEPYRVDERMLSTEEDRRHRAAVSAAIVAGKSVHEAYDAADESVREYRARAFASTRKESGARYRLANSQERIEAWVASKDAFGPLHIAIVRRLDANGPSLLRTREEMRQVAGVPDEPIDLLIRWGVLMREEGARSLPSPAPDVENPVWVGRCGACGQIVAAVEDSTTLQDDDARKVSWTIGRMVVNRLSVDRVAGPVTAGKCRCGAQDRSENISAPSLHQVAMEAIARAEAHGFGGQEADRAG